MSSGRTASFTRASANGVHPGVGPDIEIVAAFNEPVANGEHVFAVEDEHLVGDLDVPHAVIIDKNVDLANTLKKLVELDDVTENDRTLIEQIHASPLIAALLGRNTTIRADYAIIT